MPGIPVPASMARRLSLPALRLRSLLAGTVGAYAVPGVWSSDIGDGGDDFPRHTQTAGGLVPGHVLVGEPEERGQCPGVAESVGVGQLQDGMDVAAQTSASDGAARPGSAERAGGSG